MKVRYLLTVTLSMLFACSKPQQDVKPLQTMNTLDNSKADAQALVDSALPFAQQMLAEYHEFFPYGASMAQDGKITAEGAYNGSEHPPSLEIINLLNNAHLAMAKNGKLRGCALVYDIRTIPPGKAEKQDAVAIAIDHFSGYTSVVIFPYSFDANQKLNMEPPFAVKGEGKIFGAGTLGK